MRKVRIRKKKIKKKSKKIIKNIDEAYLDYDFNIEDEFRKSLKSLGDKSVNMDIINKLPKLDSDKIKESIEPNKKKLKIKLKIQKPRAESIDIDINSLDKQIIGNKVYYIDYDKGIIYDELLNSVGNIGEFGEINV